MIERVLIANRGEIAVRIARTCRRLGVRTVAVFSDADAGGLHVRRADEAVRLPGSSPADTYLRIDLLLDAAQRTGADAVHPGYGFLAESAELASAVIETGLIWIGPPPAAIIAMGSKIEAKARMRSAGVPVLPDSDVEGIDAIGYPLLVKASAGGGGRGMRIVRSADDLDEARTAAAREALAAFGDGTVFCERYVERGRHVEIQIVADTHGNVASLHERECSIQRRHQKIVEECPSPAVDDELRRRMGAAAADAARSVGYVGAGTVEFLLDPDGGFAFLEMNTRLQVEHPVTELVTGIDLVALQLAVAEGRPLPPAAMEPALDGHAIEARLTAEDPAAGYLPSTGTFTEFKINTSGVRVDAGVETGSVVPPQYDSLVAKVIAHGSTREDAARTLAGALQHARLHGVTTNRDQLVAVLRHPAFLASDLHTGFLDEHGITGSDAGDVATAAAVAALARQAANRRTATALSAIESGWRNNSGIDRSIELAHGATTTTVSYRFGRSPSIAVDGRPVDVRLVEATDSAVTVDVDGVRRTFHTAICDERIDVDGPDGHTSFTVLPRFPDADADAAAAAGSLVAPMPGAVLRLLVGAGDEVTGGQPLVVVEAMKMEHSVTAPGPGRVAEVLVSVGDQVATGQALLRIESP